MREPISLKEVLAVVIKRGWGILIAAVAVAALLGGLQLKKQMDYSKLPENSAEQIEAEYQEAMAQREEQLKALQEALENTELLLNRQEIYNDASALMKIDPYNVYKSIVAFSIDLLDTDDANGKLDQSEDRYNRMLARLRDIYTTCWKVADLREEFKAYGFGDMKDMYIRELVSMEVTEEGMITITVRCESAADVERLADAASKWLMRLCDAKETAAYAHSLTLLERATKIVISSEIKNHQESNRENEKNLLQERESLGKEIENMPVPQRRAGYSMKEILSASAKWSMIGFVIGGILGCAWVLVLYLFRSRVESSRQMEQILGVPFLGSVAKQGDLFHRLADWMLVERVWKDSAEAEAFLANSLQVAAGEAGEVLVLTTLQDKTAESALNAVEKAAAALGTKVVALQNAEGNPKTTDALRGCKCVVLAERVGVSDIHQMKALLDTAQRMESAVIGFVTI